MIQWHIFHVTDKPTLLCHSSSCKFQQFLRRSFCQPHQALATVFEVLSSHFIVSAKTLLTKHLLCAKTFYILCPGCIHLNHIQTADDWNKMYQSNDDVWIFICYNDDNIIFSDTDQRNSVRNHSSGKCIRSYQPGMKHDANKAPIKYIC